MYKCMSMSVWVWMYEYECTIMNIWVYEYECMSVRVRMYEYVALCESSSWICPRLYRRPRHVVTPCLWSKLIGFYILPASRIKKRRILQRAMSRPVSHWCELVARLGNGEPMDLMHHQLFPLANFPAAQRRKFSSTTIWRKNINFQSAVVASLSIFASAKLSWCYFELQHGLVTTYRMQMSRQPT